MRRDLLIVGTGGLARETAQIIRRLSDRFRLVGFLDDDPTRHGMELAGTAVIGPVDVAADYASLVLIATGSPRDYDSRRRLAQRLDLPEERYATVVDPVAVVAATCTIGPGSIVMAGCVLTTDVVVGRHVALMPQVVLTHDDAIGDYVTAGAGAVVAGAVHIGAGAYLGSRCAVREHVRVGAGSLVGLGSVVLQDVPDGQVWAGVPARFLRPAAATAS